MANGVDEVVLRFMQQLIADAGYRYCNALCAVITIPSWHLIVCSSIYTKSCVQIQNKLLLIIVIFS